MTDLRLRRRFVPTRRRRPYGRDTLHTVDCIERGWAHPDRTGPVEMAQLVGGSHAMSMAEGDLRAQLAQVTQSYLK